MSCTCLCNGDIDGDNCMVRGMQGRDAPHNHCVVQKLHQFHQGGASNIIIITFVFAGQLYTFDQIPVKWEYVVVEG